MLHHLEGAHLSSLFLKASVFSLTRECSPQGFVEESRASHPESHPGWQLPGFALHPQCWVDGALTMLDENKESSELDVLVSKPSPCLIRQQIMPGRGINLPKSCNMSVPPVYCDF